MPLVPATGRVEYNGYQFGPYTTTESVQGRPVYDSAGRTVTHIVYAITLKTRIYAFDGNNQVPTDSAMENIRRRLSTPGGKFYYQDKGFGDFTINVGGRKDVVWGPKPKILSWKPRGGDLAGDLTWQVEVAIPECTTAKYTFPPGVLSFNFSVNYAIDQAGFTRRTYKGTVVIPQTRKSVTDRNIYQTADDMREKIAAEPPLGIRLISQNYTIDESKNKLDFDIVWEDMPAALPPGVISCNASHTVSSRERSLTQWQGIISADYELAREYDRAYAYQLFWQLVLHRIKRVDFAKGSEVYQEAIPISVSVSEPEIYGRNKSRFSLSYWYGCPINMFLECSGLFQAVPGVDAVAWRASMLNSAMHPRGFAKMKFDPKSDGIIDLCATPAKLKNENAFVVNKTYAKDISTFATCPHPAYSWLDYDLRVRTHYEDETVELRTLPLNPISAEKYGALKTYGFDVTKQNDPNAVGATIDNNKATQYPYPPGSIVNQFSSEVQVRVPAAIVVTIEGAAMRACWPIQPPNLLNVGNAIAVPIRRDDNFFFTHVVANKFVPINAAAWRQSYFLYGNPGAIGVVPNPLLGAK
jgi:hypothetical protein